VISLINKSFDPILLSSARNGQQFFFAEFVLLKKESIMKTNKTKFGLVTFFMLMAIISVTAQKQGDPIPKCKAEANQIYYVDSGQSVTEVHPGGNGYQLNIIGAGADKFAVVKEPYMVSVSVIPNYTNAAQAKWAIVFAPKMGQVVSRIRMRSECTGKAVHEYTLTESVRLLDQ
jgi:hypothetical protein